MDARSQRRLGGIALAVGVILLSWGHIVAFAMAFLGATLPLLVGAAIAYVVNIMLSFLEAHLLAHSTSAAVAALRRPMCLLLSLALIVVSVSLAVSLLFPAVIESVSVIRTKGLVALDDLARLPTFKTIFEEARKALAGNGWEALGATRVSDFVKQNAGTILGLLGDQIFAVVTSFTTVFFGIVFSVALLLDLDRMGAQVSHVLATYLGARRFERVAGILSVFDRSFHNYIVRQCTEAAILGATAAVILLVTGFPYAVGIASLVGFASLVPIVGFPVAAWAGAFLVFTERPLLAIIFLAILFVVQGLESNLVLPRVGDPKTVLTGAWPIVAVTIGGGVGGFIGMLVGNPIGSAIYQLVHDDTVRRDTHEQTRTEEA